MAYGAVAADTVQSSTTGTPPQFNDGSGAQIGTLCRAWVLFNGSTIYGSFNVTSVTVNSAGNFSVNFTKAMPDTNYSAFTTNDTGTDVLRYSGVSSGGFGTSSLTVLSAYLSAGSLAAASLGKQSVAVFR